MFNSNNIKLEPCCGGIPKTPEVINLVDDSDDEQLPSDQAPVKEELISVSCYEDLYKLLEEELSGTSKERDEKFAQLIKTSIETSKKGAFFRAFFNYVSCPVHSATLLKDLELMKTLCNYYQSVPWMDRMSKMKSSVQEIEAIKSFLI